MKIIAHASNTTKNANRKCSKGKITSAKINPIVDEIELDVSITKDNVLVCTHITKINGQRIVDTCYKDLEEINILKLEDVLSIIDGEKSLLLDIKSDNDNRTKLLDALDNLFSTYNKYSYTVESLDYDFLKEFYKNNKDVPYMVVANYFVSLKKINLSKILDDSSGIALASEYFMFDKKNKRVGEMINGDQKIYGWLWTELYPEWDIFYKMMIDYEYKNGKRVDGIIANNVNGVERLIKNR